MKKILITGGAGFIGSALIRHIISETEYSIINIDKLTYAGNLDSLSEVEGSNRYSFYQEDICDLTTLKEIFVHHKPDFVMHLAAESHVDRSINAPGDFMRTNIFGTYALLEATRTYWQDLAGEQRLNFRFLHVSTDEVYGDLQESGLLFTERTPYAPSSPYSASKASSDHLVRAWHRTYGLPILITNCSNNYGPYQFPEKLIPLMILNAKEGKNLPVYGSGKQIRDWLYVEDHVKALICVIEKGKVGDTYNIGGLNEKENIQIVKEICATLEELIPQKPAGLDRYEDLITHVDDRPGHDVRYAIDATKIQNELGWSPLESFETGLHKTIKWYLNNPNWYQRIENGDYQKQVSGAAK